MSTDAETARRVGIDGFNLALPRGTGVATYARMLSHTLASMECKVDVVYGMNIDRRMPASLREVMFFDSLNEDAKQRRPRAFTGTWFEDRRSGILGHEAIEISMSGRVDQRDFAARMPSYDRIMNVPDIFRRSAVHFRRTKRFLDIRVPNTPAIMHWTYPLPLRLVGARNIYTVHDLVPLRLPHTTLDNKQYHFRLLSEIVERADAICTVSEASRSDIVSFFPASEKKVFNTYQSFVPHEHLAPPPVLDREIDALFGLSAGGYYLFFGSLEPKKNIGRMIEGFLASRTSRPLVIVGAMAWKSAEELRFIDRGVATGRIIRLEYLRHSVLLALIARARAVLFPSLNEGFGLPVLEALSLGTPVVTSREGALPEVAGDAALYADAYNTTSITAAIDTMDADDDTHAALAARSSAQAERFAPVRYAERLRSMYAGLWSA